MIWTPLTTIMTVLGIFGLALMLFSATKAFSITRKSGHASLEEKYVLEKEYYLLSTVVWIILASRLVASGLFWATNESLIALIPGAMCQFGVYQAGSPYSWIDQGIKLMVVLVYGIWLVLDFINRRTKGSPLLASLSRLFILMTPLLFIDTALDLLFYGSLEPVTVPCCRIVFDQTSAVPCPYCFVFHDAPLFLVVVASYGLSIAAVVWSMAIRHYLKIGGDLESVGMAAIRRLVTFSLIFAVIGTIALVPAILQVIGAGVFVH
jgi:hypothetical protein